MADRTARGSKGSGGDGDRLRDFLVTLATDPAALGNFVKDAEAAMSAADLDPADQAVLRSGDPNVINTRIAGGPSGAAPMVLVVDVTDDVPSVRGLAPQFPLQQILQPPQFPQFPQFPVQPPVFPIRQLQVFPQVVAPQIVPPLQQIFPQIVPPQVTPQIVPPQVVVGPQIVPPQIVPPQLVFPQQIFPQIVAPQIVPPVIVSPLFSQ
jgi:hypothetical protein